MKHAIAIAGNIIVDSIKYIDSYPGKLELAAIRRIEKSVGGAVPNVGIDLARLDPSLPVKAIGFVGEDEDGHMALEALGRYPSIDLSDIRRAGTTSFTDVMTIAATGERTFFTYKGADSLLTPRTLSAGDLECDILHVGYALLLDGMDAPDAQYGTAMARALHDAQRRGIRTSLDVVSENSDRYREIVVPVLKYVDYFSVNELEAGRITGLSLLESGRVRRDRLRESLEALRAMGVRQRAVIHTPEISCGLDEDGRYIEIPTLRLPDGFIKGSVGAGDAFTAGLLYRTWQGAPLDAALETANAVAALSLSAPGSTEGVPSLDEVTAFAARVAEM